ncbi:acyltransferase family protein [Jatrophihabitans sp. DSM 45814]
MTVVAEGSDIGPALPTNRLAGLDGLRGLAVAAVVMFHLDSALLPGGFLGVDVFFVISGFLITRLLLLEIVDSERLRLGRFYARRARRLFPAVAVLLVAVIASSLVWSDERSTLHASVASSLGYVTNWWLIFAHQSYFVSTGRPPMLQHLWSLAIEEQYYLLWSVAVFLLAVRSRRGRRKRSVASAVRLVGVNAFILALASTFAMTILAVRTEVPYVSDSSRVYFGTDTHSMGLFLGSAAGAWFVLRSFRTPADLTRARRAPIWATDSMALLGLVVLCWQFRHLNEYTPGLYRGGFLGISALTVLVVCAVVRRGGALGPIIDRQPMRWVGERSYSIYLWHWPVVVVTRPGIDLHGPVLLIDAARLGLILVLGAASYRFVERPLRSVSRRRDSIRSSGSAEPEGVIVTASRMSTERPAPITSRPAGPLNRPAPGPGVAHGLLAGATALICVAVLTLSAGAAVTANAGNANAGTLNARSDRPSSASTLAPDIRSSLPSTPAHPRVNSSAARQPVTRPGAPPHRLAPSTAERLALPVVSAFGDSVLLGATSALLALDGRVKVDAVEGRQAYVVLDEIAALHRTGQLAPTVVIHTGNNGVINPAQLSSTLSMLRDRARVVLVTDRVARDWQDPNNRAIRTAAHQFSNVRLVDWNSIGGSHPAWFYGDGLHLNPAGAASYAQLIMAAVKRV